MILQRTSDQLIAVKQDDHAAFAAFLLEHWSDHKFPDNPNREAIITATREHDNGWIVFDNVPPLDANGLPIDFMHTSPEQTFEVWQRGTARFLESDPFVALLITHHAYSLHESEHKRDPEWKEFFTIFARQRAELRTELGLTHNQIEMAYSFLRMVDWFSLAWCLYPELGQEKAEKYGGYSYRRDGEDGNAYEFRPYPFDERDLVYRLPYYPLNPDGYESSEALAADMAEPRYQEIVLHQLERFAE